MSTEIAVGTKCAGGECGPGEAVCFTAGTLVATTSGEVPVEEVEIGDRARQFDGTACSAEPVSKNLASCAVVELEFPNPYGYEDTLIVELMRSTAWLEANEVEVGGWVRLAFEELKVDDDGWVRSISSCPEIQPGDGCVVTGTFTHLNDDVHELTFVGSDVVLQPTGLHPLWSEDRDGWVRTHELKIGERLRSEQGPLEIATIRRLEGAHQVFNLEVASIRIWYRTRRFSVTMSARTEKTIPKMFNPKAKMRNIGTNFGTIRVKGKRARWHERRLACSGSA